MQLLLLGGYSPHNKAWIHEVGQALEPLADKCVVHDYAHWDSGRDMDFETELSAIAAETRGLEGKDYAVFAKSIGIILSVEAISRGLLAPKACVFAGLPLGAVQEQGKTFGKQLANLSCPATFVQNSHDPLGSFEDVQDYLRQTHPANYTLVELPGDTHSYADFDKIKKLVSDALGQG